jgi:hypothetical protein
MAARKRVAKAKKGAKNGATSSRKTAKRSSRRRQGNSLDAVKAGEAMAESVLALRQAQRGRRSAVAAQTRAMTSTRAVSAVPVPEATLRALGPRGTAGVLIAEGDSWFDYPGRDVLALLEDDYGFDVESVADKGDCIEEMAYSEGQFVQFTRRLEKLLADRKVPRAILLSGGGNDIAGDEFAILLNHAASGMKTLNEDIVRGVIDVRLRNAYTFMISALTAICRKHLNRAIPIVVHGYGNPVPDGRGFMGGASFLPGPWLKPGFDKKGHGDRDANTRVMEALIDRFNTMLQAVQQTAGFGHVRYIDLRSELPNDPASYKRYWANELHPSPQGFDIVTAVFVRAIEAL